MEVNGKKRMNREEQHKLRNTQKEVGVIKEKASDEVRIRLRQSISSPTEGWCVGVGGILFRRTSALYLPTYANTLKSVA